MLDAIGIAGAAIILISMILPSTHRRQNILMRFINIIGSIILTWYSFALCAYCNAFLNIIVSIVNIFYIIKLYISMKKDNKKLFSYIKTKDDMENL